MKKVILSLIFVQIIIGSTNMYAQQSLDDEIYKYLSKKIRYPQLLIDDAFRAGEKVGVKFTINNNGHIDSVSVYTTTSNLLSSNVKSLVMTLNDWLPAKYDKNYGKRTYILPLIYIATYKDTDNKMLKESREYFSKSPHLKKYPECKNSCIVLKPLEIFALKTVH